MRRRSTAVCRGRRVNMDKTDQIETHDSTRPVSSTTEARQAVRQNVLYVLAASLVLVIAAFAAIYYW